MWVEVREQYTHRLLFRYDPCRLLVEIRQRGMTSLVDLTTIQAATAGTINQPPIDSTHVLV